MGRICLYVAKLPPRGTKLRTIGWFPLTGGPNSQLNPSFVAEWPGPMGPEANQKRHLHHHSQGLFLKA